MHLSELDIPHLALFSSPLARQTLYLWGIELFANVADYAYHLFLGRALLPQQFAEVQTIHATLLILITAFGVLQPVVARLVAGDRQASGAGPLGPGPISRSGFQYYFRSALALGGVTTAAAWLARGSLAGWLNVTPGAVAAGSVMILLALARPVIAGYLQGGQRFVSYGLLRLIQAVLRLAFGLVMVGVGFGTMGAVAALPLGATFALAFGLAIAGREIWRRAEPLSETFRRQGYSLSLSAFVAFLAFMSTLNTDLIWVNRTFSGEVAGGYATAVLLRRVLSLLPAAVVAILFPKVVSETTRQRSPDSAVGKTIALVTSLTLAITLVYAVFGGMIVEWMFGSAYLTGAIPYLGWMGLGLVGYGLGSVWMTVYLATRPAPYVVWLAVVAVAQYLAYARWHGSLEQVTSIFCLGGLFLAAGGMILYLFWLRPQFPSASSVR